ncbi:MAG: TIGR03032 family protein [Pseudomonadota bacterium]
MTGSRLFTAWLAGEGASLAFTTYQAGKLFLIGLQPDGRLSIFERTFARCMGLGVGPHEALWMASLCQLWRFENFLEPGEQKDGFDAVYVPVVGHTTGDLDVHDIHTDAAGRPVFVATRFNCLATIAERASFRPLWRPPFVDRIAAEDRCHLNGFAMRDGAPAYATCVAATNVAEGWREHRRDGGRVLDVASGESVAAGLSMPHSPRLHQGRLWLVQSGTGEFGHVDLASGRFQPVCFLPGFARGVAFAGDHAVIGVSLPRETATFAGLALEERLAREGVGARCQLAVVNLVTGDVEHRLAIEGVVEELYDVVVLPGLVRPMALGFRSDEIRFYVRPSEARGRV